MTSDCSLPGPVSGLLLIISLNSPMLYCLHSDGNCNVKFRCFSLIPSDKKMRSLQQSDEASREVSAGDTETLRHSLPYF